MTDRRTMQKIAFIAIALSLIAFFYLSGGNEYVTFQNLKSQQNSLRQMVESNWVRFAILYSATYVLTTALSLPGATILTLAGGALFGLKTGLILVSVASTLGATLAFVSARFLFRDLVERKFQTLWKRVRDGFEREGVFYLVALRLVPVFPFFLVNLLMGLTRMPTLLYAFVSQLAMLPGTFVYVNAGTELAAIESPGEILSPRLIIAFVIIGILPLISRWAIYHWRNRRHPREHRKPKQFDYNLVVIGGGAAGLVTSYIAAAVKAKVALVEEEKMGGDCLNTGCIPSKALIRSARAVYETQRAQRFGLKDVSLELDFAEVMERVQRVVKSIAPHDSIERYTSLGVECITGRGMIQSPYEVKVDDRVLTTRAIVIATGASPRIPEIPGLVTTPYLTSENIWKLRELPQKLVILGGGPIGCELAQAFQRLGSQVTIIEATNSLLAREDQEVGTFLRARFEREGIKVLTGHKVIEIQSGSKARCMTEEGLQEISFDHILLALGRKANVTGFGLEDLGIEISQQGMIVADENLRTTLYPNIYVCGDVAGPHQFTHTASHQAWYAAVNSLFSPLSSYKVDYRIIPWCTYTDPEIARVGLNEREALEKGIQYTVSTYSLSGLDRAITEEEAYGFIKVLTPPRSDKVLGVTVVGSHAGEIIAEYVLAMKHGIGLNKILGTIHIYPTWSEANRHVAGVWKKASVSPRILTLLAKIHKLRRRV